MSVKYEYVVKRPDSKPEIEVWQNDAQRQSYLGRSRLYGYINLKEFLGHCCIKVRCNRISSGGY